MLSPALPLSPQPAHLSLPHPHVHHSHFRTRRAHDGNHLTEPCPSPAHRPGERPGAVLDPDSSSPHSSTSPSAFGSSPKLLRGVPPLASPSDPPQGRTTLPIRHPTSSGCGLSPSPSSAARPACPPRSANPALIPPHDASPLPPP